MTNNKLVHSMKWSGFSEIAAKLITPLTTMILARILAPEAFGVVAICNMLVSFVDIIVDAGFGKYMVQADFKTKDDCYKNASTAFWIQIFIAIFIWFLILIFKRPLAYLLGNEEYDDVIVIASLQLIIVSLSSVQTGLLRRNFEFKKLFKIRIATAAIPLLISVPLALVLKSYWAMIIGTLSSACTNAIMLYSMSEWKPRIYFSMYRLKNMWKFSFWSMCEGLAHWTIFWVDIFIIGRLYSAYYVGLYKNTTQIIVSLIGMITAAMSPVLLSNFSRIKDIDISNNLFYHIEKLFMYILLPMGIILYFYRDVFTLIVLGDKWIEGAIILGLWGAMMVISIFIYSFPAEAFKSRGIPKILFFYQTAYLLCIVPICWYFAKINFWEFVYARVACIAFQIVLFLIFVKIFLNWKFKQFFSMIYKPICGAILFIGICLLIEKTEYFSNDIYLQLISLAITLIIYFGLWWIMFRKDFKTVFKSLKTKSI